MWPGVCNDANNVSSVRGSLLFSTWNLITNGETAPWSLPLHHSYTPKRHVRTLGRRIRIDVNNDKRLTELWVRFAGKESYRRVYDINKCTSQTWQYRDSEDKERPSSLPWLLVITAVFSKSGCEDVALLCSGTKEINVFKRVPIRP